MRRAARVDDNHAEIVRALRQVGCSVLSLAPLGKDAPDLLCGVRGVDALMEVKDGAKSPSRRRLKAGQEEFHKLWRGRPVIVVHSAEEALAAVAKMGT